MARVMVAANIWRGIGVSGGSLLLSSCCRRGAPPPASNAPFLLSAKCGCYCCSTSYYSPVKENGKGALSLSLSVDVQTKKAAAAAARRRVFCTAPDVAAVESSSSAAVPTATASSSTDGDLMMIKDAAKTLDIRVGQILRAWRHEAADSLYVEEVDVGEPQPRIICSGLVNYIPLHQLQDKKVVVIANLKPRNMRGVKSHGMLMAASDASHENVELLVPREGSVPGERIWFGSADEIGNLPDAATPNQIQKKKIWELVQPHLKTDGLCVAALGIHLMQTSAGLVVCRSLKNANIS